MAPSSKSEKDGNKQTLRKHKEHVVKLLNRGKLSGQYSQRLFRKLPPRVCVPLKNIVSEEFLRAGHIFLGFTKCGRYVLSYTSDCGEDDDFSFYTYHLYWWEFNLHSRLKQVHHVRLFTGEDIYSDLYLTVCEWPTTTPRSSSLASNTRSSSSVLMNLMMSDENNRDIYITIASMPPLRPCSQCCPPNTSTIQCLEHGYMLNSRYQVVYPFPTFQPGYEDDKVQLPFTVTDLKGRNLQLVTGVCVEQLTLDFEYLINEVIRSDARWAAQFCSFNDYDVVILEVCPETNTVVINIGLLLLAFSNPEEEHCRPNTYHSSLQVSWDLNTGVCHTVGVGDLTEVKGQTSGSVWSSYRKSCVNTVMKWLVPESSSRYINRMTNELVGCSLRGGPFLMHTKL
uniref:DDB1 and CUL4 associated factor 15 n=1 Tax=Oncorhynchus kisutch TaxID=8019 RepID=A0A8C7H2K0_ONCKI